MFIIDAVYYMKTIIIIHFFVGLVAYLDIKNSYKPVIEKQSLYSQLKYFSYVLELNTHF